MPLGLMPGMSYEEKEIILEAGETALFYSDGLVEAHDPKGAMFGFPRLRELVAEHGEESSLGDFLLEELYSFVGEGLGAGGRRHSSDAPASSYEQLKFREHPF
jgi:serine phosphatase RsbU (regulator of sigma subunit)